MRFNKIIFLISFSVVSITAFSAPSPTSYAPTLELSDSGVIGTELNEKFWEEKINDFDTLVEFYSAYDSKLIDYPYTDYYPVDATNFINNSNPTLTNLRNGNIPQALMNSSYGLDLNLNEDDDLDQSNEIEMAELSFVIAHQFENFLPTSHYYEFHNPFWENPYALQYWFYYTNNDWSSDHIGDWEGVSLFFDEDENPAEGNYSTHYEARKYNWADLTHNGTSPTVFVSHGGHGSYGREGNTTFAPLYTDNHGGNAAGGIGRFQVETVNLKNSNVLSYSTRWGNTGSPLGPRFREDVKQSVLDKVLAKDPYNSCKSMGTIRIFGESNELPDYQAMKGIDDSEKESLIKSVTNHGPWRWASGYFADNSCEDIDSPEKVTEFEITQTDDDIELNWEVDPDSSSRPFGFTLSAYLSANISNKKHSIIAFPDSCDDAGICNTTINLADYGLVGEDAANLCVAVTAWNPAGDKGEEAVCLKPNFAIVVDDTGSMSEEISTIKSQLVSSVANASSTLEEQPIFHLVTFKDGATHRLISADTNKVISAIGGLYAYGGGNCPESAGSGLLMAANEIKENGRLIWATDAAVNDHATVGRARAILADKSVAITTLLSGDCNETKTATKSRKVLGSTGITFIEEIDSGDNGENAPPSQKVTSPKTKSSITTKATKGEEFRTFDSLDWEADDGLTDGATVLTGYREGFIDRYIGFADDWKDDLSDMFSIYLNPGIYEIRVEVPSHYNSSQYINIQLYDIDGNEVVTGGYSNYLSTYKVIVDTSMQTSWFALKVSYSEAIQPYTPVKYRVFVEESPYAFMSTRELFEAVTNDLNGNYYYVPEIKKGDAKTYEEALESAFNKAFQATIKSTSGSLVAGEKSEIKVTIENAKWASGDSLKLVSDSTGDEFDASIISGVGTYTLKSTVTLPYEAKISAMQMKANNGCYSVVAVIGGATVTANCAFRLLSGSAGNGLSNIPSQGTIGLVLIFIIQLTIVMLRKRRSR